MARDMGAMPVPKLTLVRFLWEESPDASTIASWLAEARWSGWRFMTRIRGIATTRPWLWASLRIRHCVGRSGSRLASLARSFVKHLLSERSNEP